MNLSGIVDGIGFILPSLTHVVFHISPNQITHKLTSLSILILILHREANTQSSSCQVKNAIIFNFFSLYYQGFMGALWITLGCFGNNSGVLGAAFGTIRRRFGQQR
tara:strand:+ start:315 stop:632 length:318 start_codon:yes stop_codon:yes gene_type:complete